MVVVSESETGMAALPCLRVTRGKRGGEIPIEFDFNMKVSVVPRRAGARHMSESLLPPLFHADET